MRWVLFVEDSFDGEQDVQNATDLFQTLQPILLDRDVALIGVVNPNNIADRYMYGIGNEPPTKKP